MPEPTPPLDLDAIAEQDCNLAHLCDCHDHVPALVARVRALEAEATEHRGLMEYRARVYQERCDELALLDRTLDAIWKMARGHGWDHADTAGLAAWLSAKLCAP